MLAWRYAHQHGFRLEACQRLGIHAGAARQVAPLFQQFLRVAEEQGLVLNERTASQEAIRQCVLTAFIDQLALRRDEGTLRCDLVHGRRGELARDSAVRHSRLFVASEIDEIEHGNHEFNVILRLATAVEEAWLAELFPEAFNERTEVVFDASGKRVISKQLTCFRDLVLKTKLAGHPQQKQRLPCWPMPSDGSVHTQVLTPAVDQGSTASNGLSNGAPSSLSVIGEEERLFVLQQLCLGSVSAKEIEDKPIWPVLKDCLAPGQEALLETYAPERLSLPCGRSARIRYAADAPPVLSARIQDLYGLEQTPAIAMGRQPLVVEILAPNQRPVQITQDLASFWKETYPALKKALQKRYPKHEWR